MGNLDMFKGSQVVIINTKRLPGFPATGVFCDFAECCSCSLATGQDLMPTVERRKLDFRSLDDAVRDAEQLLTKGYRSAGNWNLAQTLGHCNDWLRFPIDGYPRPKFPINLLMAVARWTIGKSMYSKTIRQRSFAPGGPTIPETVKPPNTQKDAEALETFIRTVERFKSFRGQPDPSPLFGKLTYDQQLELQVIHLQHHLSFLVPNQT